MNINEYINSGILEEYAVGVTSNQETQEVKCMSHIYPDIRTELLKLEDAMGQYARLYEKKPPAALKEKIFSQMTFGERVSGKLSDEDNITIVKVVPLWSKISVAAAILIAALAAYLYNESNKTKDQVQALSVKAGEMENQNLASQKFLALYRNADIKVIKLAGKEISPESSADVFWNQKNQEVAVNVVNLPKPQAGKQYQLWTIVDGVPVDMGVLDNDFEGKVLKMKAASGKVVAFAITLEKEGGSPSPTLEQMYVMGPV